MADGRVEFEIVADGSKAYASIDKITNELKKQGLVWEKNAKDSTDEIGNSFDGMLKKIVGGISAAAIGKAILDWGKAAIDAASDLEEVQNVVDVTFGGSANKIEKWAKEAGDQFGLTETQAKRFTSTLGAMMKSAGMSGDEIADISTDLAGLAADMASFYNLDFDTAFNKIRSGISGETEPLKQLGINMSVANLEAFALQQGLSKTFSEMSQGEQTMLRYQYLMQATADAQGDFARTSDGYANSQRRLETALETLKTKMGAPFLNVVATASTALADFISQITQEKPRTVLDDFADIDVKTQEKIAQIEATAGEARTLTDVLDGIGTKLNKVGEGTIDAGSDIQKLLEPLEGATNGITAENELWIETCERLTEVLPGLKDIINTETGEIKGGTQAIRDYIDAWEKGQKGIAYQNAHTQKQAALDSYAAELPGLELNKTVAEYRVRKAREQLNDILEKYGLSGDYTADTIRNFEAGSAYATSTLGLDADRSETLSKEIKYYQTLKNNANDATQAYNEQKAAYDEAVEAYEYEGRVINETYGEAIENAKTWAEENGEAAQKALDDTQAALDALHEYVQGIHDATLGEIESTVKGLEGIETPAQKARKEMAQLKKDLNDLGSRTEDNADKWDKLNAKISEYGGKVPSAESIKQGLQSQLDFMDEYLRNLELARDRGISGELLASLSDGSVESADYLAALATATDDQVKEINEKYKAVEDNKKKMADQLTDQKLTVDQTYQEMVDAARKAIEELDLGQQAADASGKTVAGLAQGIADHVGDVQTQVDAIIAQLDRLNGYGIDIDFGQFGNVHFETQVEKGGIGHRAGLNNVPYDGYLAELHQGEAVLTHQENQIWQSFKSGMRDNINYEQLGGVMRENVQAGGNVYLDGKTVGRVMSDQQGAQYRSLQRSGWQSGR